LSRAFQVRTNDGSTIDEGQLHKGSCCNFNTWMRTLDVALVQNEKNWEL